MRLEHLDDGMLGGDLLDARPGAGVRAEGDIADHAGVGRQDVGVLGAKPGSSFRLGLLGLPAGNLQPVIEPLEFRSTASAAICRGGNRIPAGRAPGSARPRFRG